MAYAETNDLKQHRAKTADKLSPILLEYFSPYFTKILVNTCVLTAVYVSSDEKADCAIWAQSLCDIAIIFVINLFRVSKNFPIL